MNIVLLGPPGAGKGTHAAGISEKYGIPHISTGDIFRENIKSGTDLGKRAKAYMDRGELVPDELVCDIAFDRLSRDDCEKGFLLDGFPRTVNQAERLDAFLENNGRKLDAVIDLEVDEEELIRRLTGRRICRNCQASYHIINMPPKREGVCDICGGELYQRDDDTEETARNRIRVYNEQTLPLTGYYRRSGRRVGIDGSGGVDKVFADIVGALGEQL